MKIIYRYFFAPLAILLYLGVVVALFDKPKQLFRLRRERRKSRPSNTGEWLWVHASSGEFEYAKAILREIKIRNPTLQILVTYTSPSYEKQIRSFEFVDHSEPLPLDLPGPLSELIRKFKPRCLLIARTDLWPELLWQCRRHSVATVLFAMAFPKPLNFLERWWKAWALQQIDTIFVIGNTDLNFATENLKLTNSIDVTGDPRFDQALHRIHHPPFPIPLRKSTVPTLIAGSTWPEDEANLLPAVKDFVENQKLKLVIAPHEPTEAHLKAIQNFFAGSKARVHLFSDSEIQDADVLIINRTGVLANLYPLGDIAFVGGSFKKKVHSVMEALVAGCPVIVGPHFRNNAEAVKYANLSVGRFANKDITAVKSVTSIENLKSYIGFFLQHPAGLKNVGTELQRQTQSERGASQRIVDRLTQLHYI